VNVKRTSRQPQKRTSRRSVSRNGLWSSLFGGSEWAYALYGSDGKLLSSGIPSRKSQQEAEAVAYFAQKNVPGVKTAAAFDLNVFPSVPDRWDASLRSMAAAGRSGMSSWGGVRSNRGRRRSR